MREILEFFVTCPKGVEGLLRDEVLALGAESAKETVAGVSVQGDIELGYRLCCWCSSVFSRAPPRTYTPACR